MSDMVLRPTRRPRARARGDRRGDPDVRGPPDQADEHLSGLIFHDDPLGRPIIGSAETVRGVDHETLRTFHAGTYTAPNVFVVAAGKLDRDELERMVEEKFSASRGRAFRQGGEAPAPESRFYFKHKETEQYHVSLGSRASRRRARTATRWRP